jgi:BRCA1-associated protein
VRLFSVFFFFFFFFFFPISSFSLRRSEDSNVFAGDVPTKRSDLVCLLAVPAHYSSDEICRFLKQYTRFMLQIRVLRDQRPDRLVLVMRFCSQEKADEFFREFNGTRFNEVEPERCRVAFLSSVEFLEPRDAELFVSVSHQHEMPTCPVCLERLEEQASGIFVTLCNHSFHCSCLAQWRSSETACPVCRYTLRCTGAGEEHASRCDRCATTEALWICLICGNVGCSRYRGAHASEHWRETGHIYALELDTQRVWDYAGDGYVHRLIQNKTDGWRRKKKKG